MGQSASHRSTSSLESRGVRRRSIRDSFRSPFPRRPRSSISNNTLSAACNFIDIECKFEQLNINMASEEELMTLPGINRSIAHTIVDYRDKIGRFKRVEDLALVSGIGAEKLDLIRPEICVSRRKNISCTSSRAQSVDSLQSTDISRSTTRNSPQSRMVDINSANVFDLMTIHSFNQEMAANIVHYRERRGPFRTVDDLIKVKGINQWRLGALRSQVFIGDSESSTENVKNDINHSEITNAESISLTSLKNANSLQVPNGKISGHRKTMSVPIKYSPLTNGLLPHKDIFELLSAYSQRPIVEEDFHNQRNGKPALRIASWNLHDFSSEKADNPGVRETICRTILENSLALIAVQEVVDNFALKKICDELNYPALRRIIDWRDDDCDWKYCIPNHSDTGQGLAFIYDANSQVEQMAVSYLNLEGCESSMSLFARFKLEDINVCLLNVHLHDNNGNSFKSIRNALDGRIQDKDILIILGDFSGIVNSIDDLDIDQSRYKSIVPKTSSTNSCNGYQELRYLDNIYLSEDALAQFTGVWGVVRQGLTHLAIPRGWMWGGPASEHCPVWSEIFTTKVGTPQTVANGRNHSTRLDV